MSDPDGHGERGKKRENWARAGTSRDLRNVFPPTVRGRSGVGRGNRFIVGYSRSIHAWRGMGEKKPSGFRGGDDSSSLKMGSLEESPRNVLLYSPYLFLITYLSPVFVREFLLTLGGHYPYKTKAGPESA